MPNSRLLWQQKVVSRLYQRDSTYVHIVGAFSGVLVYFRYAVFRSCWRYARPFWNRRRIHRSGNGRARFQEACSGDPLLDYACWRREEAFTSRCCCAGTLSSGLSRHLTLLWWFAKCVAFLYCSHCFHVYMTLGLDQFSADPASTIFGAIGHQLFTLCRALCGVEKGQKLYPLMKIWYHHVPVSGIVPYLKFILLFMSTELGDVLDRLQRGLSQPARPVRKQQTPVQTKAPQKNKVWSKKI